MTYEWPLYASLFLGVWSALVGGVFKAFSEFIMSGLAQARPAGGIESMQQINRTVLKTEFVVALISIALFSVVFAVYGAFAFEGAVRVVLILAALVYVPSVFLVTVGGNVPMNEKLDRLDYASFEAEAYWERYAKVWTRLNHLRTLGSILTAGLYIIAAITLITSGQV